MKTIEVYCSGEGEVVGTMEFGPGKQKITSNTFLRVFRPKSADYMFSGAELKNTGYVICPRCRSFLGFKTQPSVAGDSKLESLKDDARRRARRIAEQMNSGPEGQRLSQPVGSHIDNNGVEKDFVRIIIGTTTLEV